MNNTEKRVLDVLQNINWLMNAHNSYAELMEIKGRKVVIRCVGICVECKIDCIETAFTESMPDITVVRQ